MINVEVKHHLKEYCRERNISITDLAEKTGLQRAGIYQEKNFTLNTVGKILVALNCKFEDLFEIIEK